MSRQSSVVGAIDAVVRCSNCGAGMGQCDCWITCSCGRSHLRTQLCWNDTAHHSVSRKHLHRYVSEAEFLYNSRNLNDGERTQELIRAVVGRRLTYADQIARPRNEKGRYRWR